MILYHISRRVDPFQTEGETNQKLETKTKICVTGNAPPQAVESVTECVRVWHRHVFFFSFFPRWHHRCRWPQLHQTQTSPKSKTIFDHLAAVARTLNIRRPFFLSCPMCWVKGFLRPTEARQFKADVLFCFLSFYLFLIQLNFEMKCWPVKTVCSWYDLTGIVLRQQKASGSLNKKNKIFKEIDKKKKRTLHFLLNYLPFLFCWPCWTINATRPSRTEEFRTWLEDKKKKHFFLFTRLQSHAKGHEKEKKMLRKRMSLKNAKAKPRWMVQ